MASPSQMVQPLRIQKGNPSASPTKSGSALPRALTELAPTEKRRNSPSFNQVSKKIIAADDSSPFQSSPFNTSEGNSSPRLFWKGRDSALANQFSSENTFSGGRDSSPSPTRRSSIERLQRASRVKNSNMFAREQKQEYDPASVPLVERPLARSLNGNAFGGSGIQGLRSSERPRPIGHQRNESKTTLPLFTPTKVPLSASASGSHSPSKDHVSPTKSSMVSKLFNPKSSFDPENGTWSEENSGDERELPPGRSLHRHAKSVTFDAAPPQVNEYEMATPDLSSVGSGSRENSYDSREDEEEDSYVLGEQPEHEDSFDASLEDTDKTPVVGPEDWRQSPEAYNRPSMPGSFDDSFDGPEGSPMPEARPASNLRSPGIRTDSLNSNGEHRPLPPLPGVMSGSPAGLSAAAERVASSTRHLPSPPAPASISKSDLQEMSGARMTLEERLRLMMIQDDDKTKTPAEIQRERRMRRAGSRDRNSQTPERDQSIQIHEDEDTLDDLPGLGTYQLPPRISRESILRKVNGQGAFPRESDYNFSSPPPSSSPERPTLPDPDTPIPSTEEASTLEVDNADNSVVIKPEPEDDDEVDVYSIPDMYQDAEHGRDAYFNEKSFTDYGTPAENDADSQYSDPTPPNFLSQLQSEKLTKEDSLSTLRDNGPEVSIHDSAKDDRKTSLPELSGVLTNNDFGLSLQAYMTPSPPIAADTKKVEEKRMSMVHAQEYLRRPLTPEQSRQMPSSKPEYDGTGWGPEEDEEDEAEPGTPDSVIRHPVSPSPPAELPVVPERIATIKSSSGSKLKTRPSATPSDIMAMRELRRQVSGEAPAIPPIPARHRNRPSIGADQEEAGEGNGTGTLERHPSLKKKSLTLDIGSDLGLGLDKDFDRVIEAQKRGYLMRQNTKVVVASSDVDKGTRSAGNSPVKKERPQSWTVEPWNGSPRKSSVRSASGSRKKPPTGPMPPMPGQESSVSGLGMVAEEAAAAPEEGAEKGRLFVKVMGVKDLDLPLPKNEKTWFSLTLDNGVHCVTTAWLELGRNAPIGQEFELVVPTELEFQLTLNAKLEKPQPKRLVESPTKKVPKPSTFSRVFTSPKKRKELEMKQKEEEQRLAKQKEHDAQLKRMSTQPTAWDLLSPLASEDGSFGRSYICLKDHEARCYGRPYTVDIACFNEWATEEVSFSSSARSKRSTTQVQRRAPYKVGKLELQLLFVPKPKGAKDEDMPKSLNSCIREIKEAETTASRAWEGHLSQQGGDCPYWRRRFFKLQGTKLTAYHESTRQPRATINLANACKLIDDRRALTQKETTGKGGKRRKSGFAEEEEGYMFVEEGFRIRFNNGEVIDFYADTGSDKEGWMKVLDACIGKDNEGVKRGWCDLVLKREESLQKRADPGTAGRRHQRTKSMIV